MNEWHTHEPVAAVDCKTLSVLVLVSPALIPQMTAGLILSSDLYLRVFNFYGVFLVSIFTTRNSKSFTTLFRYML